MNKLLISNRITRVAIPLGISAIAAAGCGSSSNSPDAHATIDAAVATSDAGLNALGSFNPGFTPTSPNTPLSIEVTISGETLGENGLPFTPVNQGDPQFVDGWDVKFNKYIVVIGNVRLTSNATQYSDQSMLNLPPVATKAGPFVIDVHQLTTNGFNGFVGADGEEPAGAIFKWDTQDDGTAFDSSQLYAFSYDTVPAAYPATQINLTQDDEQVYALMVQHGWNKYIEATATHVATGAFPDAPTQAKFDALAGGTLNEDGSVLKAPQFTFVFGWNDATSSINCINPNNGDMDEANLANRGVQPDTNGATVAQVTIHTDHVFWDKLKQEGTPLRMDYLAAWAAPDTSVTPLDLGSLGTKPLATTFADGTPLPDRAPYLNNPTGTFISDQTDPSQVTLDLNGVTASDIKGVANFMAFSAQSQTHLNANGLCYIKGQNSSDPFFMPNVTP